MSMLLIHVARFSNAVRQALFARPGPKKDGGIDDTAQRVAVGAGARQDWFNVGVGQRGDGGIVHCYIKLLIDMLYETARALKRGFKHAYTFKTDKTPLVSCRLCLPFTHVGKCNEPKNTAFITPSPDIYANGPKSPKMQASQQPPRQQQHQDRQTNQAPIYTVLPSLFPLHPSAASFKAFKTLA